MLTLEKLAEFGADTETGLKRCVNKESLYFRLVRKVPEREDFSKLADAAAAGDYEAAFQAAHGLKGVLTNLSLDSLSRPVIEITDHLRIGEEIDYRPLLDEIELKRRELAELCRD